MTLRPRLNSGMVEVAPGVVRVTFPLPFGLDHVHCYLLRSSDGGWTAVDTGLGLPDAGRRWAAILSELDGPVERIFITHFHPDHVGAASDLAELTGVAVLQGDVDHAQCVRAWSAGSSERLAEHMRLHGLPDEALDSLRRESAGLRSVTHFAEATQAVGEGDSVDGWDVVSLPGHADGHLALLRDGVLVAGDAILGAITPAIGLYPEARPNPLDDYLGSLRRIAELGPRVAFAGHGEPVDEPAARAHAIGAHHDQRLAKTADALRGGPQTAYEASLELWPEQLAPVLRRFALAETCAHAEYLVHAGSAERHAEDGRVRYQVTA
jgi:glyoxylase-like metal-dependent hydrolase (beta-lactamase superfamily II)